MVPTINLQGVPALRIRHDQSLVEAPNSKSVSIPILRTAPSIILNECEYRTIGTIAASGIYQALGVLDFAFPGLRAPGNSLGSKRHLLSPKIRES